MCFGRWVDLWLRPVLGISHDCQWIHSLAAGRGCMLGPYVLQQVGWLGRVDKDTLLQQRPYLSGQRYGHSLPELILPHGPLGPFVPTCSPL